MIILLLLLEIKDVESLFKIKAPFLTSIYSTMTTCYIKESLKFWSNIVMLQSLFLLLQGWISIFVSFLESESIAYRMIKWHYYSFINKKFIPLKSPILWYISRIQFIKKWLQ